MSQTFREETILDDAQVRRVIDTLARNLDADITKPEKRVVVGIRRGGGVVAEMLQARLQEMRGIGIPIGFLDITFYRDDLDTVGPNPVVGATDLSMDIDGKRIILVDDVLYSGRTIRAALNALFDFGRPEIVDLAVLVDRGHRQLPIKADYAGLTLQSERGERIKLVQSGENKLALVRRVAV